MKSPICRTLAHWRNWSRRGFLLVVAVLASSCAGSRERYCRITGSSSDFGERIMADPSAQGALERVLSVHGFTKAWDTPPTLITYAKPKGQKSQVSIGNDDGSRIGVSVWLSGPGLVVSASHLYLDHMPFAEGVAQRVARALQVHYPNQTIRLSIEDGWSNPW